MSSVLLSSTYLPPISYVKLLLQNEKVILDVHEHFLKQTYRNRCCIYGANGKLNLIVPVAKKQSKQLMRDVIISYNENWQNVHWRSLSSAYRSSPYFEYYEHRFAPFYEKNYKYLVDFNQELLSTLLELLQINCDLKKTDSFIPYEDNGDHRKEIHPKVVTDKTTPEYVQVFSDKQGFIDNLSIVDLLFNEGNNANAYL